MRFLRYGYIYMFLAVIALLLTWVVHPLLPRYFSKYKITFSEDPQIVPNPEIVFRDLDHDGFSEKIVLKYQRNIHEPAIKIYAYNGGLIDQWTFNERWLPNSLIFGDFDHDDQDEVYAFTRTQDSLFLYAVDVRQKHSFLLSRIFITRAPQKVRNWDIRSIAGDFLDADSDGFDDLVFNVMAGHALQPRTLFSFSIKKRRLLFRSPKSYAFLARPSVVNGQDASKILMEGSVALANAPKSYPYADNAAWLMVFDHHLRFAFPPVPFQGRSTELKAFPFGSDNNRIITLVNYEDKTRKFARLVLFDWQGKPILQKEIRDRNWNLVQFYEHGHKSTILLNPIKGIWANLDEYLQIKLHSMSIKNVKCDFFQAYDLDKDFEEEFIFVKGSSLIILRHDFKHPVKVALPSIDWQNVHLSLRQNGEKAPDLYLQGGEKKYFIRYAYNPLFPFAFTAQFMLFAVFFLMLLSAFYAYAFIVGYQKVITELLKSPDRGILIFDYKGKIRYMNHALIDQFRLGLTDFKGKQVLHIFEPFPTIVSFLNELVRSPGALKKEIIVKDKNITLKGKIYGQPLTSLLHFPLGFFVELNDYSRPLESDRLKSWSRTVQKMAHDIKAPLSSIAVNLMTLDLKLEETAPKAHQKIEPELAMLLNEVERVKEKTVNFLKFTNLEELNFGWVDIKALIEGTVALFKSYGQKSVQFNIDLDPEIKQIYADEKQLRMALQAIIENAIDAMQAMGTIAISVSGTSHVDKGFHEFVEIDIADTGPGIPKEIIGKVFEPYFTTKKNGTGMGLAIAMKIIREHHGDMEIISTDHFSTVVKIILPIDYHNGTRLNEISENK